MQTIQTLPPVVTSSVSHDNNDDAEDEVLKAQSQVEFFNGKLDDKDEAWAIKQCQGRKSDASLSCPACFTTLCIDYQRHERYVHQYRAMFVSNRRVVENEQLRLPAHCETRRNQRRKKKGAAANIEADIGETVPEAASEDIFKPVRCSVRDTEVVVIENDEVYHFFNIMPSYL